MTQAPILGLVGSDTFRCRPSAATIVRLSATRPATSAAVTPASLVDPEVIAVESVSVNALRLPSLTSCSVLGNLGLAARRHFPIYNFATLGATDG